MANAKSEEPEIEIRVRKSGVDNWKKWGKVKKANTRQGNNGALYFMGFIGSLIYWCKAAIGFGAVVTALLKSFVWPAYVVYKLLENFYGYVR